jgi:hypothetical protein
MLSNNSLTNHSSPLEITVVLNKANGVLGYLLFLSTAIPDL